MFDARMVRATAVLDPQSLNLIKPLISRCLVISRDDSPFEKMGDILLLLYSLRDALENALQDK